MMRWLTYGGAAPSVKAGGGIFALCLAAAPVAAQADQVLLALGDSLTQGYGLIEQEGFVPQLRAYLEAQGRDVRVVNGGVSGDTTAGGLARVAWSLTPDVDAMMVTLGGNDLLRGIAPDVARANLEGILKVAAENDVEVLLVGMQAPGNYGPEYKEAFDAMYPDLAQAYGADFAPSFFEGMMEEGGSLVEMSEFMQSDGIHPNAQGVARIVSALGPRVEALLDRVE